MTVELQSPAPSAAAESGGKRPRQRQDRSAWGFLAPSGIGFVVFTLAPIAASVVLALFAWPVLGAKEFVGLDNFVALFTEDPIFWIALRNTLIFVALYVPLNLFVALGLAVWINSRPRFRGFYRVLFFLPAVTPMVANALVWKMLLQPGGIVDGYLQTWFGFEPTNILGNPTTAMLSVVLMSVWMGFGYNLLVFSAGLDGIPEHLYEAAAIDGAGPIRRFISITIPMLSPSMFFAGVMTTITSLQVFAQPYILTGGGPGVSTETMVMYLYQRGFQFFDLGSAASIATVLFLVIVLISGVQFVAQRKWVHYDN